PSEISACSRARCSDIGKNGCGKPSWASRNMYASVVEACPSWAFRDIREHFIPGLTADGLPGATSAQRRFGASAVSLGIKWNELNRSAAPWFGTGDAAGLWGLDARRPLCFARRNAPQAAFADEGPPLPVPESVRSRQRNVGSRTLAAANTGMGAPAASLGSESLPTTAHQEAQRPTAYEELTPGGSPCSPEDGDSLGRRRTRSKVPCPHSGQRVPSGPVRSWSQARAGGGKGATGSSASPNSRRQRGNCCALSRLLKKR